MYSDQDPDPDLQALDSQTGDTRQPRTAAGRDLFQWMTHGPGGYNDANARYWLPRILAIEAEAAVASGSAEPEVSPAPLDAIIADLRWQIRNDTDSSAWRNGATWALDELAARLAAGDQEQTDE